MNTRPLITLVLTATVVLTACCQTQESSPQTPRESLVVGDVSITLQDGGLLSVVGGAQGDTTINIELPYPETCDFVRLIGTNVIHIERYYDAWIALIQCHRRVDLQETDPRFGCDTRYKALVIRDDGMVFLNPESNGGTGCPPIMRDRHEFTSLAFDYVHKDDEK